MKYIGIFITIIIFILNLNYIAHAQTNEVIGLNNDNQIGFSVSPFNSSNYEVILQQCLELINNDKIDDSKILFAKLVKDSNNNWEYINKYITCLLTYVDKSNLDLNKKMNLLNDINIFLKSSYVFIDFKFIEELKKLSSMVENKIIIFENQIVEESNKSNETNLNNKLEALKIIINKDIINNKIEAQKELNDIINIKNSINLTDQVLNQKIELSIEKHEFYIQLSNLIEEGFYYLHQFYITNNIVFLNAANNIHNNLILLSPKIVEKKLINSINIIRKINWFKNDLEKYKLEYDKSLTNKLDSLVAVCDEYFSDRQKKIDALINCLIELDNLSKKVITQDSITKITLSTKIINNAIEKIRDNQFNSYQSDAVSDLDFAFGKYTSISSISTYNTKQTIIFDAIKYMKKIDTRLLNFETQSLYNTIYNKLYDYLTDDDKIKFTKKFNESSKKKYSDF